MDEQSGRYDLLADSYDGGKCCDATRCDLANGIIDGRSIHLNGSRKDAEDGYAAGSLVLPGMMLKRRRTLCLRIWTQRKGLLRCRQRVVAGGVKFLTKTNG